METREGIKVLHPPLTDEDVLQLHAGDAVEITGVIYGARDAAHQRMTEMLERGEPLPFEIRGAIIYYVGPTPARPGYPSGSAGPTTSSRVDKFTPRLLALGLKGMVGKGSRGREVREAIKEHKAVYLAALGGGGALAARKIRSSRPIAFEDLGPEAVWEMEVEGFPAWVINDAYGRDYYEEAMKPWRRPEILGEPAP